MAALPRSIVVRMCMAGCEMPSYLLFEAEDLDAAIELAAQIPAARMRGAIEVRPIVEW